MAATDKAAIIATLRAHQEELMRAGIAHAALFGSHARGEAGPDSEIDILIEFAPGQRAGVFGYAGMQLKISDLFRGTLPTLLKDAVYAF